VRRVNVDGSARVFRAVADAGVRSLVYASSVGAYSRGPKDRLVDESWPTDVLRGATVATCAATPPLDPSKTRAQELATRVGGDE
jgi:nucleoside-diphosphate-sugar epimerase